MKKWKKYCWRYFHFTHVYQKYQSCDVWFLRYGVRQNVLSFWATFCSFTPVMISKIKTLKLWKTEKNTWRYCCFTHVYHIWQSCDEWFLRYGVQWVERFVILDCFSPYYPAMDPKNQTFAKMKIIPDDIIILHKCTINYNHIMYLRYGAKQTEFFVILDHFLPFYSTPLPLTNPKIEILQKWKQGLEISSFYTSAP